VRAAAAARRPHASASQHQPAPASTGVRNSNRSISVAAIVPGSIPLSLNQGALNHSMALETNWSYTRTRLRGRCWRAGDHRARGKAAGDRRQDGGHRHAERRLHRRVSGLNARAALTRLEAIDCHELRESLR
jgi:hypothetical protein